jgi:DNA polymerase I
MKAQRNGHAPAFRRESLPCGGTNEGACRTTPPEVQAHEINEGNEERPDAFPGSTAAGPHTAYEINEGNEKSPAAFPGTATAKLRPAYELNEGNEESPACLVRDAGLFPTVLQALDESGAVAVDTETTGLDPRRDRVRLLTLATTRGTFVLDCFAVDPRPLFDALAVPTLVMHNAAFDLAMLAAVGFVPGPVRCTMLLSQLLDGVRQAKGFHSLEACTQRHLGIALDKTLQGSDWSGVLSAEHLRYAARDAEVTLQLHEALATKVNAVGMERVTGIESRCLPAMAWMSAAGAPFDLAAWMALADEAAADVARLRAELDGAAPANGMFAGNWNWDSPVEVKKAFAAAGVAMEKTDDDTLAGVNHPMADLLRDYRSATKRAGTYGTDWTEYVRDDGRVRADFRQIGCASGRMSCASPNLQNLPRDPRYRRCFAAPPGRLLLKADYSQIELRVAAKVAGERRMLDAYRRGEDLHTLTARQFTGRQEVTKQERQLAKPVNFGLIYGLSSATLRTKAKAEYGLDLTAAQADGYRQAFFRAWPGIAAWHARIRREGGTETRTLTGRRRLVDADRWYGGRANDVVQGTAGDGLKQALALLWERRDECPGAFPVLVVHDEIVVEADEAQADRAAAWLREAMLDGMSPLIDPVPVDIEVKVARTWAGD